MIVTETLCCSKDKGKNKYKNYQVFFFFLALKSVKGLISNRELREIAQTKLQKPTAIVSLDSKTGAFARKDWT